jgi:DNA-binding response OmpR family regulator
MFLVPRSLNVEVVPLSEVPLPDSTPFPSQCEPIVMVVDDERLIADTLSAIFTKVGFETMTAYDGESALALARKIQPTILVSDVCLPGMNGIALAAAITEVIPECKILLLSANVAAAEEVMALYESGCEFHFLAKPVHPTILVDRVANLIDSKKRPHSPLAWRTANS